MSDRIERLLELLSPDGQTSPERAYPALLDLGPGACARCQRVAVEGVEFCPRCRAFLLGDSDIDPSAPAATFEVSAAVGQLEDLTAAWQVIVDALAEYSRQVEAAFGAMGDALAAFGVTVQELVDAFAAQRDEVYPPSPPSARDRERGLLAQRRRANRRSARWGPPPGRGRSRR